MKFTTFLLLMSLFVISSCSAQSIVYKPIGEMDKPLPTIIISTKESNSLNNFTKTFNVNSNMYNILKQYILNSDLKKNTANEVEQFGSYKIILINNDKSVEYIIEAQNSHYFFEQQLEIVKSNPILYEQLIILLKRIK